MIEHLSQQTITEYASEALTTQKPEGTDYSQGVRVGRTIPAKWWNWLFNAVTKRLIQSNADAQDMLEEMQNVVTDAGITLDDTDNTQLSQAIDAKAEDKIDAYVDAKRNATINMWSSNTIRRSFNMYAGRPGGANRLGTIETLYTSGYKMASNQYMVEVNGVYFAKGTNAWTSLTKSGLIFSPDLLNWFAATEFIGRENTGIARHEYLQYGVLYFRGYWFIITVSVYRATITDQFSFTTKVTRSADLTEWETIYTDTWVYALDGYNKKVMMFVFDDTLYFSDCRGDMYKTTDGTTCTATGATGIDFGWEWAAIAPVQISDNCCIINNYLFDKLAESMTNIVAAGYNIRVRSVVVRLSGGKCVVGSAASHGTYGATTMGSSMYIVDSNGTITQLTGEDTYQIRAAVDGVLLRYVAASQTWQFSTDGTNFSDMAYDGSNYLWPVCTVEGTVICASGTSKLYSIEGGLSSNLADYTLLNASLPNYVSSVMSGEFNCQMFYSAYDNALVVPGAISYDKGVNWVQGTVTTTTSTYNYAGPAQGKDIYGRRVGFCGATSEETYGTPEVAETHPRINRVFGHTLYLQ